MRYYKAAFRALPRIESLDVTQREGDSFFVTPAKVLNVLDFAAPRYKGGVVSMGRIGVPHP